MAEVVNRNVEAMLSELAECERKNIFDAAEVKMILKKRTQYEYRLQRRIVKKMDFLRYIQFELCVDRLRRNRCKLRRIAGSSSSLDFGIVQRIHRLFRSATQKFKGDLNLWLEYIKFCQKGKSPKKLQQAVQDALKYHSYCDGLWVLAAKFEFEHDNIDSARLSMVSALRMLPTSEKVWLEYFRMELLHVDKLRKRYIATVAGRNGALSDEQKKELESAKFSCITADKIYTAATNASDIVSFHRRFLDIYRLFNFTERSRDVVYANLAERHSASPEAADILCMRPLHDQIVWDIAGRSKREMECDTLYKAAVERIPTQAMWDRYCQFWRSTVDHYQVKRSAVSLQKSVQQYFKVCQQALEAGVVSADVGCQWIEMLLMSGHDDSARSVLDQLILMHSSNVDLLLKRRSLTIDCNA